MESPEFAHLYTLAALAMTFVGFSVIVMVLRQSLGHKLTRFDILLAHVYMEFGLMISAGSLVPPLLMRWELSPSMVWRVSSVVAALPLIIFAVTYPRRRRAASGEPSPFYALFNSFVVLLIGLCFLMNAFVLQDHLAAAFITVMTAFLIFSTCTFLQALNVILKHRPQTIE